MAQRVGRGIALLFHDRGTRRGEWSAARPGHTLPPARPGPHFTGGCVPRCPEGSRKLRFPDYILLILLLLLLLFTSFTP